MYREYDRFPNVKGVEVVQIVIKSVKVVAKVIISKRELIYLAVIILVLLKQCGLPVHFEEFGKMLQVPFPLK